jgi:hypothetical protein
MKKHILRTIVCIIAIFAMPPAVFAGTLSLVTDKTQFAIGDEFSVDVKIDSEGVGINAAQATLNFPVAVLQETSVDKINSVFTFWLQDPIADNSVGEIKFIGGSTSGVSGKTLQTLRVTFKVVGAGSAEVSFTDGAITAADGNGTNVLSTTKGLNITSITKQEAARIIPPPVIPPVQIIKRPAVPTGKLPAKPILTIPLYPVSGGWYNSISSFLVHWQLPADITAVATVLNQQPTSATSTAVSEGLFDNKTFPSIIDGTWYLHVRFKNDIGWGPATDYKISIDTAPPLAFEVISTDGPATYNVAPSILFESKDQPSGIALYHILVDQKEETTSLLTTYTLLPQSAGKHAVTVIAEDLAGNKTSTTITVDILAQAFLSIGSFSLSQFQFFIVIICIILVIFIAWWYSYRLWKEQLERRVLIAERDVSNTLTIISDDAEKIIEQAKEGHINVKELNEMSFLAKKIKGKISDAKKYIIDNIREISQK